MTTVPPSPAAEQLGADLYAPWPDGTAFCHKQGGAQPAEALTARSQPGAPLQITAYAQAQRQYAERGLLGRRRGARIVRCHYVSFRYGAGGAEACARAELAAAFRTLVSDWGELRVRAAACLALFERAPAEGPRPHAPKGGPVGVEEAVAFEAAFLQRRAQLALRCESATQRLAWSADGLEAHLRALAQMEDGGLAPRVWVRYPYPVTVADTRFAARPPRSRPIIGKPMTDFAFRAAKLINSSGPHPTVEALHRELERFATELLAFKGFETETLGQHLPARRAMAAPPDDPAEAPPPYEATEGESSRRERE